jgi:hypothetical protein
MPNEYDDVKPPTTHVGDIGDRRGQMADGNSPLIERVFNKAYPDAKLVDNIVSMVSDGKIQDKGGLANEAANAHAQSQTRQLQDAVNKKLADAKSPYRIKIDDSMAGVQDIGSISVDLIDTSSRKVVDTCARPIDNSPRVQYPERPHIDRPPVQQMPSDLPRLDIVDPPSRRKSPWS